MANLDNVVDVFAGATFNNASDGNLVVPSGQIPRMSQGDNVAEGAELVYALLSALNVAVNAAGNENENVSSSVSNTFSASALTMTRQFSFTTTLDVSSSIDDFDVKLDTTNKSQNLSLQGVNLSGGDPNVTTAGVVDKGDDAATGNPVIARIDLEVNGVATDYNARYTYTVEDAVSADMNGNVSARFEVVNVGTDWFLRVIDGQLASISEETHALTIAVDDNTVDFAQEGGAFTVPVSVVAQA